MKKIYLYGNWKMNMLQAETATFFKNFVAAVDSKMLGEAIGSRVEVAIFPPYTSLAAAQHALTSIDKRISPYLGAQNVYFESSGAFTGEISTSMLKESGCTHVIIGHSERRALFGEKDTLLTQKVKACLDAELTPVFCYGETLTEREQNRTFEVITSQLHALDSFSSTDLKRIIYAYEPVWAIGTGKSATSAEAQEVCAYSKKLLQKLANTPIEVRVLYGGSVKADNAHELLSMEDIDGALVGGASLKADSFLEIYKAYATY